MSEKITFSFKKLEKMVPEWISQFRSFDGQKIGDYSYVPRGPVSLYGTTDTLISLSIIDQLDLTEPEKDEWAETVNRFQDPLTGWYNKTFTHHYKEHTTAYAIAALKLIDKSPKYPLSWKEKILFNKKSMEKWINSCNWSLIWPGSHSISGIPAALLMNNQGSQEFYDWYFNWLDAEVDRQSGFWRRGLHHKLNIFSKPNLHDMAGAFHMYYVYAYCKRPWKFPEKAIDYTLKFQKPNGFWNGDSTYCVDLDAIYTMLRGSEILGGYREKEIKESVVKYLKNAEKTLNDRDFLYTHYKNSHKLTGALCAIAECQKFYPDLVVTEKKWVQTLDIACYI